MRTATEVPPQPGDKIRATGVNRQQFNYTPAIFGGMLQIASADK
jgi:hypothetical protein